MNDRAKFVDVGGELAEIKQCLMFARRFLISSLLRLAEAKKGGDYQDIVAAKRRVRLEWQDVASLKRRRQALLQGVPRE